MSQPVITLWSDADFLTVRDVCLCRAAGKEPAF